MARSRGSGAPFAVPASQKAGRVGPSRGSLSADGRACRPPSARRRAYGTFLSSPESHQGTGWQRAHHAESAS